MDKFVKIIVVFILLLVAGQRGLAQSSTAQSDSLRIRERKGQTEENANEQNPKEMGNKQQTGKINGSQKADVPI